MNESPQMNNKLARVALYRLMQEFTASDALSPENSRKLEGLILRAVGCTQTADNLCEKYYIDIRDFSGWIGITQGRDALEYFMQVVQDYRIQDDKKRNNSNTPIG
jgi:hypothetical protein